MPQESFRQLAAERPGVDPAFTPLLDLMNAPDAVPMSRMDPGDARASFRLLDDLTGPPVEGVTTTDRTIPGPAGELPVRIVVPDGERRGILVWFHGGGFVIGDLESADAMTRRLALAAGCTVVSVEYRLAPEHPAPAAGDDCWAALTWVADNRAELAEADAPLAVGGDSAGGNLAAVTAQHAGGPDGPELAVQLLVYPTVEFDLTGERYSSYEENGEGLFLTTDSMAWFGAHYLGPDGDATDPTIAPMHADDATLAATAPAIVQVAGYDPLRDEGLAYADRLRDLGVDVDLGWYPTMLHGFWGMVALTPIADEAIAAAGEQVRRRFASV